MTDVCTVCEGTGRDFHPFDSTCEVCAGQGVVQSESRLTRERVRLMANVTETLGLRHAVEWLTRRLGS